MRSRVSWMDGHPAVYRCFLSGSAVLSRVCRILPPSVTHRGAPIARVCRAETLSGLPVNRDSIYQAHVFAQFGFITEARRFIPAALYLVPASAQSLLHAQGKFLFQADAVRQPLMMKARCIDGRLRLHAKAHPVENTQRRDENDAWPAGRAGDEAQLAIAQEYGGRHGTERAV